MQICRTRASGNMALVAAAASLMSGCLSGGGSGSDVDIITSIQHGSSNSPPQISGNPAKVVTAGVSYSFTPDAFDPNGDSLSFSVDRLPSWADFSQSNGRISGAPSPADVGVYSDISISVSDGAASDTLGPFSIEVVAQGAATGSVTLDWTAPTINEDGSSLTDLAGYRIYWRVDPGYFPYSITVDNPSITRFVVETLAPGTYEFAATSFNNAGVESRFSNITIKSVP